MSRLVRLMFFALLALAVCPAAAGAATVSITADTVEVDDASADENVITITADATTYTVVEEGAGLALTAVGPCTGGGAEGVAVQCPRGAPDSNQNKAEVNLGNAPVTSVQVVTIGTGVGRASVRGGSGRDEIRGGAAGDVLDGEGGPDQVDGEGGEDIVDGGPGDDAVNGGEGPDSLYGGLGSDTIADLGTTGADTAIYDESGRTTGVDITLDGHRNDGSEADDGAARDLITGEIENAVGTNFADAIDGDDGPNLLSGDEGEDVLTGHGGADFLSGGAHADTLHADDGVRDTQLNCNDGFSAGTNPNTVFIDVGLDEPVVVDCSAVLAGAGSGHGTGGGTPTTGGGTQTTGGGTTQTPSATPPAVLAPAARPAFFAVQTTGGSTTVSTMPNVVGVKAATARERVLAAIPSADLDIEFRRGCAASQDGEVMRQTPIRGTAVSNHARDPVAVTLVVCLADRDFLRDCDLTDLRADLRKVRGRTDAEFVTALLDGVNRCKVDFDVRLAKAAKEAEIALAAQKAAARKTKAGEIRAAIDCPSSPDQSDLRVYAKEHFVTGRVKTSFGLRASGVGGWTLPAGFDSFVTLEGIDRAFRFLGNPTTYVDADDVTSKGNTKRNQVIEWRSGRAVFSLFPEKAGVIRICTVMETGGDEVLSHALQIRVVPRPANGTRWETIGGRVIEIGPTGGRWLTTAETSARPTANAAFLDKVWGFIVGLFDGRSRTVTAQNAERRPNRAKVEAVYTQAKVGMAQLSLDGTLDGDPQPPVIRDGPCFITQPDGRVTLGTCKQLQPAGGSSALLGTSYGSAPIVAAGAGNIVAAGAGNMVAAGAGNLIGPDGASLIGPDGASLIGPDGASIVAAGAGNIVAAGAGNIVAAGGGNAISVAPAQIVAAGGGNIVAAGAGNMVAAGGLN